MMYSYRHRLAPFVLSAVVAALVGISPAWPQADVPPPPYLGDGDLYPDAVMDEKDIAKFIEYWRLFARHGQLTPEADFNDNEAIDHDDAAWLLGEYLRLYDVYHTSQAPAIPSSTAIATAPSRTSIPDRAPASRGSPLTATVPQARARPLLATSSDAPSATGAPLTRVNTLCIHYNEPGARGGVRD